MICYSPIKLPSGTSVSCRQCRACRVNKKREVVGRMILENFGKPEAGSFVTLTYNDESLPGRNLRPKDLTDYIKRLRRPLGNIRFLAVGEYGEKSLRPHFHIIFFNVPNTRPNFDLLEKKWNFKDDPTGFIHMGELNQATMDYVAGYTIKKMTNKKDRLLKNLNLKVPEFVRYSREPILGYRGLNAIADWLTTPQGAHRLANEGIPSSFRFKGTLWPLRWQDRINIANMLDIPQLEYEQQHHWHDETYAVPLYQVQREMWQVYTDRSPIHKTGEEKQARLNELGRQEDEILLMLKHDQAEKRLQHYKATKVKRRKHL